MERLAQFPPKSLRWELDALMLHELAHVAGLGEDDAIYIQKYSIERLSAPCHVSLYSSDPIWNHHYFNVEVISSVFYVVHEILVDPAPQVGGRIDLIAPLLRGQDIGYISNQVLQSNVSYDSKQVPITGVWVYGSGCMR